MRTSFAIRTVVGSELEQRYTHSLVGCKRRRRRPPVVSASLSYFYGRVENHVLLRLSALRSHFSLTIVSGQRGILVTLAAALRGPKGGILLCSDQEWNDANVSKRQMDKNYRIRELRDCEFFISGAGPDTPILRAWEEIHENLLRAEAAGCDLVTEHKGILEPVLEKVHKQFTKLLRNWPMSLLVVAAPRSLDRVPILYRSDEAALLHEPYYYAVGSGKPVADYLADRLYEPGRLAKRDLVILAAFILREAGDSSLGVGMGTNMVFIQEGEKALHFMPSATVKEMQEGIPSLQQAIGSYWPGRISFPDWMGS